VHLNHEPLKSLSEHFQLTCEVQITLRNRKKLEHRETCDMRSPNSTKYLGYLPSPKVFDERQISAMNVTPNLLA